MSVRFHESSVPLLIPIDSVHQLPGNYRNGDVERIMESITVNGFYGAVIADHATGEILAGNHRYAALLGLGATQIPVLWADAVDYHARLRIAVVDNRLNDLAVNDPALLAHMLAELSDSEMGLIGSGWVEEEFTRLLTETDVDPVPEAEGFGFAVNDIYQCVIECASQEEMEEVYAACKDREWNVRKVVM